MHKVKPMQIGASGKFDLSVSDCSTIVGARGTGLSMSETADLLGFSVEFIKNGYISSNCISYSIEGDTLF